MSRKSPDSFAPPCSRTGHLPAVALGAATGSGASFPATAYSKWCQDSGLCSYTSKGSTGGINDFINGVVDFAATDAPLTPQQLSDLASKRGGATPLYFPTLNPGVSFPGASITKCVRSDGSGTSFGFTSYLSKVSTSFRGAIGAGQQPNWPTSGVVKGPRNPGVASCIKSNSNSIGYVDISDARDAGLTAKFSRIGKSEIVKKNGKRQRATVYILPSAGAASKAANLTKFKADLTLSPASPASPAKGAYPITITTWMLAYSSYGSAGKSATSREDVKKVLNYAYGSTAQSGLKDLRFAPLPPALIQVAKAQIKKIK